MEPLSRQAFVGMGANLGDRWATLKAAMTRLESHPQIHFLQSSSIYETDPVGPTAQPMFLNLVVGLETTLSPEALLQTLMDIETEFGRIRNERWGPRTLDLDLLAYENETRSSGMLELPHPRMFERAFVTVPLRELVLQPRFKNASWTALENQLARTQNKKGVRLFAAADQNQL